MRMFWAVASSLVVAGCFGPASKVDSNATLTVAGAAARQNGDADATAQVLLIRHPDALQAIGDVITIIGSVGLACVAGNDSLCSPYARATVGGSGSFSFPPIHGADTKGSTGEALLFSTWLTGPAASPPASAPGGVGVDFYIQSSQVTIPSLRLWETAGSVADAGGSAQFSWSSLDSAIGTPADDYRLQITTASGLTIWSAKAGSSTSATIDPRVTQDFAGNWAIWAHRKIAGADTDFNVTWYSPSTAWASRGLVPASRGKDCYVQGASGPVQQSPCALTDGDLATRFQPLTAPACPAGQTCTPPQQNNWVYVDLGAPTTLSALVVYDLNLGIGSATIEGSMDATTWSPIGILPSTPYSLVPLSGSARYVRLRLVDPMGQLPATGNSELAIF